MSRISVACLGILSVLLIGSWMAPAKAHPSVDYYPRLWDGPLTELFLHQERA